jgi:hypothetical protein
MNAATFAADALHEIGHALGLKHPRPGSGAVQEPYLTNSDEYYYSYSVMFQAEANSDFSGLPTYRFRIVLLPTAVDCFSDAIELVIRHCPQPTVDPIVVDADASGESRWRAV